MPLHPAIFLDRDGVIIENRSNYVRSWQDVAIYPQALEALRRISRSSYKIVIVTNQSVVGRGLISLSEARSINDRLLGEIRRAGGRVDGVFMCPHTPQADCGCRKPRPGLLLEAVQTLSLDVRRSLLIGDALSDALAAKAAKVRYVAMVRTGRGAVQWLRPEVDHLIPIFSFNTLADALNELIG